MQSWGNTKVQGNRIFLRIHAHAIVFLPGVQVKIKRFKKEPSLIAVKIFTILSRILIIGLLFTCRQCTVCIAAPGAGPRLW